MNDFTKQVVAVFVYYALFVNQLMAILPDPDWWTRGGSPIVTHSTVAENHAIANIGQAKFMAKSALDAIRAIDPALATSIEVKLTTPQPNPNLPGQNLPAILNFTVPNPKPPDWNQNQRKSLLVGQLKAIAAPFYQALHTAHPDWLETQLVGNGTKDIANPLNYFPWTSATSDDKNKALATTGQLKSVFALRFEKFSLQSTKDSDGDGIPDEWEIAHGSNPFLYDRDTIDPTTGKSFWDSYRDSLVGVAAANTADITPPAGSVPALSLPTHQSIETVKGALATMPDGSASYSIPIDLPKGTAGIEPKISIDYSSAGGNGHCGLGWGISGFQVITREARPADANNSFAPLLFSSSDSLFFDGKKLVCVSGTSGVSGSEYRTEIDTYSRIRLLGSGTNTYWQVETKAGLIYTLGNATDASIVVDQGVVEWNLSRVEDSGGNYYSVSYVRDSATTTRNIINRRVSEIAYTGNASRDPYCKVTFAYESREDVSRKHSKYVSRTVSKRISKILVTTGSYTNHSYRLSYDYSYQTGRSLLKSVGKYIGDSTSLPVKPLVFSYDGLQEPVAGSEAHPIWHSSYAYNLPVYGTIMDASGEVNSVVSGSSDDTSITLTGDVSRVYNLPGEGIKIYPDTKVTFEFGSSRLSTGAIFGFDSDRSYSTSDTGLWRIRTSADNEIAMEGGTDFPDSDLNYNLHDWTTYTCNIGGRKGTTAGFLMKYLVMMCFDSSAANGNDVATFRNIRIYRSGSQSAADVEPIHFSTRAELPRYDGSGRPAGMKWIDINSDGLKDFTNFSLVGYPGPNDLNLSTPVSRGDIFMSSGRNFYRNNDYLPENNMPLAESAPSTFAMGENLMAEPIDVDRDGFIDLLIPDSPVYTDRNVESGYVFYTFQDGEWKKKSLWTLPFISKNFGTQPTFHQLRHTYFTWKDMNADGFPDLIVRTSAFGKLYSLTGNNVILDDSSETVFLNKGLNGGGWELDNSRRLPIPLVEPRTYDTGLSYLSPIAVGRTLLDVDGDGLLEFIESAGGSNPIRKVFRMNNLSAGYKWSPSATATATLAADSFNLPLSPSIDLWVPPHGTWLPTTPASLVDLNADGLPDLLQSVKGSTPYYALNYGVRDGPAWLKQTAPTGTSFVSQESYDMPLPLTDEFSMSNFNQQAPFGYEMSDLNGDGLPDMFYQECNDDVLPGPVRTVLLNTGTGWKRRDAWNAPDNSTYFNTKYERWAKYRRMRLQDIDCDGFPDLLVNTYYSHPTVYFNKCRPEILKTVTDGFGSQIEISYLRINDPTPADPQGRRIYEKGAMPAAGSGQAAVIDARWVVSSITRPGALGGTVSQRMRYGDLRYDHKNRSWLGFAWIETTDESSGQITQVDYSREYPFAGSPVRSRTWISLSQGDVNEIQTIYPGLTAGNKLLSEEVMEYVDLATTGEIRRPVLKTSVGIARNLVGVVAQVSSVFTYDSYGFLTKSIVTDDLTGRITTTNNGYDHMVDSGKWFIGRLTSSTVKKDLGGATVTRTATFGYDAATGLRTSEIAQPGHALSVSKYYGYYGGNINSTTVMASGKSRVSKTVWDANGRFPESSTDPGNLVVKTGYDNLRALVSSLSDVNDAVTNFSYDSYGVQTQTSYPDGTKTGQATGYATNAALPNDVSNALGSSNVAFYRAKQSSGGATDKIYYDAQGRELVKEAMVLRNNGASGSARYAKSFCVSNYNGKGWRTRISLPFAEGEAIRWGVMSYDPLGNLIKTTSPDGKIDQLVSKGAENIGSVRCTKTISSNKAGQQLTRWENPQGLVVRTMDTSGLVTDYEHDLDGNILRVLTAGAESVENTYDLFSNRKTVEEKNSGTSSAEYDGFGQVISTINARGQSTTFEYDILGRLVVENKPEGSYRTYYDGAVGKGKGKFWKTVGAEGYWEEVFYDAMQRPVRTRKTQFGETTYVHASYDVLGRVYGEADAGGLGIVHQYDPLVGAPISLKIAPGVAGSIREGANKDLWIAGTYNSQGQALTQTIGQGVTTTVGYNDLSGKLETQLARDVNGQLIQDRKYEWDPVEKGNLSSRSDFIASRKEFLHYDGLNRVTHSFVDTNTSAVSHTFDPNSKDFDYAINGNLEKKGAGTLLYENSARPHTVTKATIKGQDRFYTYDTDGYLLRENRGTATSTDRRDFEWTSFGQLRALDYLAAAAIQNLAGTQIYAASRVQTNFSFDADGNRARQLKTRIAADGSRELEETTYLGSYERELRMSQANGSATPQLKKITHRHTLGGLGVYTRTVTNSGTETTLGTVLSDHLGSTDVIYTGKWVNNVLVDSTVERQSFDPWGERRNAGNLNNFRSGSADAYRTTASSYNRGYTGHEQLDDSGLIHMNGRIYDPEIGRMLSPDPFVQSSENSQNHNRYSYVMNNPLNLTDPSGYTYVDGEGPVVIQDKMTVTAYQAYHDSPFQYWLYFSFKDYNPLRPDVTMFQGDGQEVAFDKYGYGFKNGIDGVVFREPDSQHRSEEAGQSSAKTDTPVKAPPREVQPSKPTQQFLNEGKPATTPATAGSIALNIAAGVLVTGAITAVAVLAAPAFIAGAIGGLVWLGVSSAAASVVVSAGVATAVAVGIRSTLLDAAEDYDNKDWNSLAFTGGGILGGLAGSRIASMAKSAFSALSTLVKKVPAVPDGAIYSTAFEMKLSPADLGRRRSVHFNRANAALDDALQDDAGLAARMEDLIPGVQQSVSRVGGRATPAEWIWHHHQDQGLMQLVPAAQHTPGSIFWNTLHPGGRGGYSIWAIPNGAPAN